MRLSDLGKFGRAPDVSGKTSIGTQQAMQRMSGKAEQTAATTPDAAVAGRATFLAASICLVASCSLPGAQVDESGLGKPTPLQREITRMYAGGGGTQLINEWFNGICPQTDLKVVVQCAAALGFSCDDQVDPDSHEALCAYEGTARIRSTAFAILPSIDGRPTSDWHDYNIKVLLYPSKTKSKYGRLIYFSNSVEVN